MHIHWGFRSVPELAALPRRERRAVIRETLRKHVGEGRQWLYALPCGVGAMLAGWLGDEWGLGGAWVALLGALGGGIGAVVGTDLLIRRARPHFSRVIEARRERAPER